MIIARYSPRRDIDDFKTVVQSRRRPARDVLLTLIPQVSSAYADYTTHRGDPRLVGKMSATDINRRRLRANYQALNNQACVSIRSDLMACAPDGKCLLCGLAPATSLDHYLPKSSYPEFSVLAPNLVPCCLNCNNLKGRRLLSEDGARFLHAYFDDLSNHAILVSDVSGAWGTLSATYRIADGVLDPDLTAAAKYQFSVLGLGEFFAREAISALAEIADDMEFLRGHVTKELAAAFVRHKMLQAVRMTGPNHWNAALLTGLELFIQSYD